MFYTYILYSKNFDRFYIGQTENLILRLNTHNAGKVKSTKHYIPWELVYFESFDSRGEALKRERFLKHQKNKSFYRKLVAQAAESRELGINHQVVGFPRTRDRSI